MRELTCHKGVTAARCRWDRVGRSTRAENKPLLLPGAGVAKCWAGEQSPVLLAGDLAKSAQPFKACSRQERGVQDGWKPDVSRLI